MHSAALAWQALDLRQKLPLIMQSAHSECGLACLAMICAYYRSDLGLHELRRRFPASGRGATLRTLMDVGSQLQFTTRALKVDLSDLRSLHMPCIVHWDMNHFVVLNKVSRDSVFLHDPAYGKRHMSFAEASRHFTGIVLELHPSQEFVPQRSTPRIKLSQFWSRITGLKRSVFQALVLSFALQLFALASPFYLQTVVDDVLLYKDLDLLVVLALGFALLLLVECGTQVLRHFVVLRLSTSL